MCRSVQAKLHKALVTINLQTIHKLDMREYDEGLNN